MTEDDAAPTISGGGTLDGGDAASTNSWGVIKNDNLAYMAPTINKRTGPDPTTAGQH